MDFRSSNDARKYRFLGAWYSWSYLFSPQLDDIGFEAGGEGEGGEGGEEGEGGAGGGQGGGESSQNRP